IDDIIQAPQGYKRKRIEFKFLDPIYIKEGAVYFHNSLKGSYLSLHVVCPAGAYYIDNNGAPHQATEDVIISTYVNYHFFQGTCAMGDELNTESCSVEIPNYYKYWLEVTVPEVDAESNGYVSIELYRKRTRIL
ncbi:MAG: hypothetical protein ACTSPI_12450, partial [Candidatus Heimdallarchaeaceae archaeon]